MEWRFRCLLYLFLFTLFIGQASSTTLAPDVDNAFAPYALVRANLHTHTNHSDARSLDPSNVMEPATVERVVQANLKHNQVVGLTDHGEHLTPGEWAEQSAFIQNSQKSGNVILRGFEVTGTEEAQKHPAYQGGWGHLLVFRTQDYAGTRLAGNGDLRFLLRSYTHFLGWLEQRPDSLAVFAHPSLYMVEETFDGFAPPPTARAAEQIVSCELSSHGPEYAGLGDGTSLRSSNEACFRMLLRRGWRLGAIMSGDEHIPPYGNASTIAGLYVDTVTETGVFDALRNRRTFGTEEPAASIRLTANTGAQSAVMGSLLQNVSEDVVIHASCHGGPRAVEYFRIVCVAADRKNDRVIVSHHLGENASHFGTILTPSFLRSRRIVAVFATARLSGKKDIISSPIFFQ